MVRGMRPQTIRQMTLRPPWPRSAGQSAGISVTPGFGSKAHAKHFEDAEGRERSHFPVG
jgi:hypothetical protein